MKRLILALTIVMAFATLALANAAPKKLMIVELSTGNSASASAEFVEIYNPNNSVIDLDGYKLEYKSATGSYWTNKVSLEGKINTRGRFLLASSQMNMISSAAIASGFAATGGQVRISNNDIVLDTLAWGNGDSPEGIAASVHEKEQSIKRLVDEDGYFIDTDNNLSDFFLSDTPSPKLDTYTAPAVATSTSSSSSNSSTTDANLANYPKIELTELLIDPESPQTDKEDEFIEIYNPNATAVDLNKYKIQSGSTTWRYNYEIESKVIGPKSYMAIYSAESGLTLSNSGAKARILDPNGKELDGVSYEKAKAGVSLSKINGKWLWTEDPTPGAANTTPGTSGDGEEASPDDSNLPHVAAASKDEGDKDDKSQSSFDEEEEKSILDTSVLVIVGGIAILYGLYEYRQDIRGKLAKLKRHFTGRRKSRATT